MTKTQNIKLDLKPIAGDIRDAWYTIQMDAGQCTRREAAELALDRLTGSAGDLLDEVIQKYGYPAVELTVANHIL
jgi:hypothetical protein